MRRLILRPCLLAALVFGSVCNAANSKETPQASVGAGKNQGSPLVKVWVNTKAHIYYCPGTPAYGQTRQGKYMTQAEALLEGNRPTDGRYCVQPEETTVVGPQSQPLVSEPPGPQPQPVVREPQGYGIAAALVLAMICAGYFLVLVTRTPFFPTLARKSKPTERRVTSTPTSVEALYAARRLLTLTANPKWRPTQERVAPARSPTDRTAEAVPAPHEEPTTLIISPDGGPLINDFVVLGGGSSWKPEDSRRYRFHLQEPATVKGTLAAIGKVSVHITGGHYSSEGAISADAVDLMLPAGTYELVVSARELASVSLHLFVHYDQ